MVTYDPDKNTTNIATCGLSFDEADRFDWAEAAIERDLRYEYGEQRFVATGQSMGDFTSSSSRLAEPTFT